MDSRCLCLIFFFPPSPSTLLFFFFTSRLSERIFFHLVCSCRFLSVYALSNISTGIKRTAGPIGIKFGVNGRWFLNRIFKLL